MDEKLKQGLGREIDAAVIDAFFSPSLSHDNAAPSEALTIEKLRRARGMFMAQRDEDLQEPYCEVVTMFRRPRSKKRRIIRKWMARRRNWRVEFWPLSHTRGLPVLPVESGANWL